MEPKAENLELSLFEKFFKLRNIFEKMDPDAP